MPNSTEYSAKSAPNRAQLPSRPLACPVIRICGPVNEVPRIPPVAVVAVKLTVAPGAKDPRPEKVRIAAPAPLWTTFTFDEPPTALRAPTV